MGRCFEWTGALRNGYGAIQVGRGVGVAYAHRLVYAAERGPIPDGYDVAHLCHNRRCVRPGHLVAATRKDNMQQSVAAGWPNGNRSMGR